MTSQLCRRIQLDLIPLFPADLEPSEAETVREHVAACTACAGELAVFVSQAARIAAARAGRRAPKLELWEGVRAALARPARGEVVAFPVAARRLVAAAASVALLVGSFVAYQRLAPTTPSGNTPVVARSPVAPTTPTGPVIANGDKGPAPGRAPRARRAPRTFFQDEGSAPFHLAQDREVTPLNEEAEVPSANGKGERYRHYEAEPGTRGTPDEAPAKDKASKGKTRKPTSESDSLSF